MGLLAPLPLRPSLMLLSRLVPLLHMVSSMVLLVRHLSRTQMEIVLAVLLQVRWNYPLLVLLPALSRQVSTVPIPASVSQDTLLLLERLVPGFSRRRRHLPLQQVHQLLVVTLVMYGGELGHQRLV